MRLYMVRHGQSEANLKQNFSGWAQIPLTQQGFEEAKRAGAYLRGKQFDRIYASDLLRAVQTAQTAIPGCEPIQLALLRENDVGTLQGLPRVEEEAKYGRFFWVRDDGADFTAFGGENHEMLRGRVREFLTLLEEDPCDQVIAFAHEGVLRCMLDLVIGKEYSRYNVRCPNCTIAVFEWAQDHWVLCGWNVGL